MRGRKMDKIGVVGIAFFSLLAVWLMWKSIVRPLWEQHLKKEMTVIFLIVLLLMLLHLLGSGLLELLKPFEEVFQR